MFVHSAALVLLSPIFNCIGVEAVPRWSQHGGLRIAGGHDVPIEKHPYQVSMEYIHSHSCGGSIITGTMILTSANCVRLVAVSAVRVRVGTATVGLGGELYRAKAVQRHPNYTPDQLLYDVGLIQVNETIVFSADVQPITIAPVGKAPAQGTSLLVIGWGPTSGEDYLDSPSLRGVWVPVLLQKACRILYRNNFLIEDSVFCAGVTGKGDCQTDEGGPVVGEDGVQYGVATNVGSCGRAGYPDVYANLADKITRDWIESRTGITG